MRPENRSWKLRAATEADAAAIARLHLDSWRSTYRGALSDAYLDTLAEDDRCRLWAARMTGPAANQRVYVADATVGPSRLVGFVCVYLDADPTWGSLIDNIHVHGSCQGTGLGRRLMRAAAECCDREARLKPIHLWVLETNQAAIRFYLRLGGAAQGQDVWAAPDGGRIPRRLIAWKAAYGMAS